MLMYDGKEKEEWVTMSRAAEIISANNGHQVSPATIRSIAHLGKIKQRPIDGRTNEYLLEDVEKYRMKRTVKKSDEV